MNWVSNILDLSIPDEGYSRNVSCALIWISTFLRCHKKSLKIPKGQSGTVYRRRIVVVHFYHLMYGLNGIATRVCGFDFRPSKVCSIRLYFRMDAKDVRRSTKVYVYPDTPVSYTI